MGEIKAALILKQHRRAEGYKFSEGLQRHTDNEHMQIRCQDTNISACVKTEVKQGRNANR